MTWLPFDVLHTLMFSVKEGKIKFIILSGYNLYRGHADITGIYFEEDYDASDWM